MSKGATDRIVRGTAVTWVKLGVTVLAQIVTTPAYLHYWSAETYGAWLAIVAAVNMLQIPGTSFQTYSGFEMMRESARDRTQFSIFLRSVVRLGGIYGLFELSVAFLLSLTVVPYILGKDATPELATHASHAFFFTALGSGLIWNWGGMWVRGASAVGHFSRWAWWGTLDSLVKVGAPLLVLPLGWGMDKVAVFLSVTLILLHQFTLWDMRKVVRLQMDMKARPNWSLAWSALVRAQVLSLKSTLEMFRRQGIRLILAPLLGMRELAAFATMRTGANAALQGLATLTSPLMPELMRFLAKRDQARSEAAMATVWMVVVAAMAPGVVVLQLFIVDLFHWWTHGKVPFDPLLFAIISSGVLVYSAAQPATSVVVGNNLVGAQLMNSVYASGTLIALTFLLVPSFGIMGAGVALLCSELVSTTGFRIVACRWLAAHDLKWPSTLAWLAAVGVLISIGAMVLIACLPSFKWMVFAAYAPAILYVVFLYWRSLPDVAMKRATQLLGKLPVIGSMVGGLNRAKAGGAS